MRKDVKFYSKGEPSESEVEDYFVKRVVYAGALQRKFVSPGVNGVTDRIVFANGGRTFFVEIKRAGKTPRSNQVREHKRMESLGFMVFIIDSYEGVDAFVDTYL